MARPTLYKHQSDRVAAAKNTAAVLREIKTNSQLTYRELSIWLGEHEIHISEEMLRQYACGSKILGASRLSQIATEAYFHQWAGAYCMASLSRIDQLELEAIRRENIANMRMLRRNLLSTLRTLYESGLSLTEIVHTVNQYLKLIEAQIGTYKEVEEVDESAPKQQTP